MTHNSISHCFVRTIHNNTESSQSPVTIEKRSYLTYLLILLTEEPEETNYAVVISWDYLVVSPKYYQPSN